MKTPKEYARDWKIRRPDYTRKQKILDSFMLEKPKYSKKAYMKPYNRQSKQIYESKRKALMRSKSCYCCGRKGTEVKITFDHISPVPKDKNYPNRSYALWKRTPSVFQFLCFSCNVSKQNSILCRLHRDKYLGIWNYLPQIEDLDLIDDKIGIKLSPLIVVDGS